MLRSISHGLRPYQLDLLGLTQSIKGLVEEVAEVGQIEFLVDIDSVDGLFSKEAEINIYRIIQECLNNMMKHARATKGKVTIHKEDVIKIIIEDNGVGLQQDTHKGLGLFNIKERVKLLEPISKIPIEIINNEVHPLKCSNCKVLDQILKQVQDDCTYF